MRVSRGVAGLAVVLALASFEGSTAVAAPLGCLPGTPSATELEAWRLAAASGLVSGQLDDAFVAQRIKQCFPTAVPQCLQRTNSYAARYDVASASQDVTPATAAEKRPPNELLRPGTTGLEFVFPENIEQIAAEREWPAVRYKSRHAGGFDSGTPSLLMVYVPGDKVTPPVNYDRWLNFALPADQGVDALKPLPQAPVPTAQDYAAEGNGGQSLPRTFTMVTLIRKDGPAPAQVFFQKFYRSGTGNPVFRPEATSSVDSCYSCHPNGLRAISPLGYHVRQDEEQLPIADWLKVKVINDAMDEMAGNKVVSWRDVAVDAAGNKKPLLVPAGQGPSVGPVAPLNGYTRSQQFITGGTLPDGTVTSGCYNRRTSVDVTDIFGRAPGANNIYRLALQPSIRWDKVRDSMKCAKCHNDKGRGALNDQTDWSQIDFKILVDQSMPLGSHSNPLDQDDVAAPVVDELTADERIALANCLQAEFEIESEQLQAWLTQGACQ